MLPVAVLLPSVIPQRLNSSLPPHLSQSHEVRIVPTPRHAVLLLDGHQVGM